MKEKTPFTVISNDAPEVKKEEPSPAQAAFNAALLSMVQFCIDTKPVSAVLAWEYMTPDGPELRSAAIPASEAILRGMVEIMHERLIDDA